MGRPAAAELIRHAFALAMAKLHILLNYPLCDVPSIEAITKLMDVERYAAEQRAPNATQRVKFDKPGLTTDVELVEMLRTKSQFDAFSGTERQTERTGRQR